MHGAALAVAALLLLSAGQPLFTEDTWWHLSLGEAYAARGPWLDADPTLHTASGPPAPAAWLWDVALHGILTGVGFQGLRVAHVLLVAGILGLAWSSLRRASGSAVFASLCGALFAAFSAYRLFQLRPHLGSVLATLLLFRLLIEGGRVPSLRRVGAAAALFALWANLHGGFVLGLALLAVATGGAGVAALLRPGERSHARLRARRLALALGVAFLASLANPAGPRQHLLYFAAGSETPALEVVADEWAPVDLFSLPVANLPPSALTWAGVWGLVLATPCLVFLQLRRRRREAASPATASVDLALAALAVVSLAGTLAAVRLLWLAIFPLLLVGESSRAQGALATPSRPVAWAGAIAALLLVPGFARFGDWPMISRGIHPALYALPYAVGKIDSHAVWFLSDAELEGNLFNDYAEGSYLGYWLAPRLRVFVNGSLNLPKDAMEARQALLLRSAAKGASFSDFLDRYRIDVFVGTGTPVVAQPNRPSVSTTTHLEKAPGWIPIFRNTRSAIYLRGDERNRENLLRVARYYEREGVPFDPGRGFDPARALQRAPRWSLGHGLVPVDYFVLEAQAASFDPTWRGPAQERIAMIQALLGRYDAAAVLYRRRLASDPSSVAAARGLVWCLLHQRNAAESLEAAARLEAIRPEDDALSRMIVSAARQHAELSEEDGAALVALLPLLPRPELQRVRAGFVSAEPRSQRR